MSNKRTVTPSPVFAPERVSAQEQAGGALLILALVWLAGVAGWIATRRRLWLAPTAVATTISAGLFRIFRSPARDTVPNAGCVLAPNDGMVRRVDMVREEGFLHGPAMRIAIEVRARDVQVTRAPQDGMLRLRRYEPGLPAARSDDALWLGIKGPNGARVAMRQSASPWWRRIPAYWARRILCWPELEETLQAGQVIGHLTLGGNVEVFLPATARIRVRAGQRVAGGETVLATIDGANSHA